MKTRKEACRYCDDKHRDRECKRWVGTNDGALSHDENNSDYVAVSNMRVWRDNHRETEGELWRFRNGGYGSEWIEVRTELRDLTTKDAIYTRAESLGLTGLTAIVDDLCSLSTYPVMDEDDAFECEMEECQEHWESYGRSDFERAMESAVGEVCDLETLMERAQGTFKSQRFNGFESTDELARFVQSNADCYPERIDSSAWDFHIEAERFGHFKLPSGVGKLVDGALECLGFAWVGCATARQHAESLPWGPERQVWADVAESVGQ